MHLYSPILLCNSNVYSNNEMYAWFTIAFVYVFLIASGSPTYDNKNETGKTALDIVSESLSLREYCV